MKKITAFKVLDHYRVWLRFDDGVEGGVGFASHVGRGVFVPWTDYAFFRQAALGEGGRTLSWPGELDFCADALWLQVTGKRPEELFPSLATARSANVPQERVSTMVRQGGGGSTGQQPAGSVPTRIPETN